MLACRPPQLEERMNRNTHGSKMISLNATVRPAYHEMNSRRKWVRLDKPRSQKLWKIGKVALRQRCECLELARKEEQGNLQPCCKPFPSPLVGISDFPFSIACWGVISPLGPLGPVARIRAPAVRAVGTARVGDRHQPAAAVGVRCVA